MTEELRPAEFWRRETLVVVTKDLYRPFRPKRRTRAMIAREKGLEPLAKSYPPPDDQSSVEEEGGKLFYQRKKCAYPGRNRGGGERQHSGGSYFG